MAELGEAAAGHEPDPARPDDPDLPRFLHGPGGYRPSGARPLAIASIVSFVSESRIVFTTQ